MRMIEKEQCVNLFNKICKTASRNPTESKCKELTNAMDAMGYVINLIMFYSFGVFK
jgi:hypothetical protein